ncbi:hypothetical protein BU24DRAFT_465035 [Aaosphaeria arxii CBS 175.79]|uniref:Uncharacterized protein n=1 Tax=Aaosphaeria arxii CBS 175.79 TaxID=1450172 RepID=A0A6A5XHG1_9PLEO|nr:uncharacterized protein BU24DRAFT_465035 [Aaosphaeria arxii CBS 175.79]KAF2012668.1 hypothetical protein BU24DRAFT_465035 [Aaosphaeria arxii CBS 175.79]
MSAVAEGEEESLRTPLELVIKTLTTHIFALASYAYLSALSRRPNRSHLQALRLLFFLFVPTLPVIEFAISAIRSIIQFCRNYEDSDETHFRFYLSAALGQHAHLKIDKEGEEKNNESVHLLNIGNGFAEKTYIPFDWVWAGKFLAALFAVTQAVGTIVMWVRRMQSHDGDALSFDHRNGAMGIASAACGVVSILTLILRLRWTVSKSFEAKEGKHSHWLGMTQSSQFIVEMLLSMLLHLIIAMIADSDNRWLYTSVGAVTFLVTSGRGASRIFFQVLQSLLLLIFIYVFRHEILRRLGFSSERSVRVFGGRQMKRVKALLVLLLVLWIITDLIRLFVIDIIQVVRESKDGWRGYWWQDPLSDSLIVI